MRRFITLLLVTAMLVHTKSVRAGDEHMSGLYNMLLGVNQTIGYQAGVHNHNSKALFVQALDVNGAFFYINYGYNYQNQIGSRVFIGSGFGTLAQLQYGYAFSDGYHHFIRIRGEVPLWVLMKSDPVNGVASGIGLYADFGINNNYGFAVGVTLSFSLWDVVTILDKK